MDLLERYLQSVKFFLPRRQQDDIVRELSENLVAQMDDRQETLGRPLNEAEQADILRRHGHPLLVAGRYLSQQHLIGPPFFPMYLFALKLGLASALLVTIVLAALRAIVSEDPVRHVVDGFLAFPSRGLMVFAWTTLGFAALDLARSRLKLSHQWDPRSLPGMIRHEDRISYAHSAGELLIAAAGVVVLLLVPQKPFLLLGPAAAFLDLAPIWRTVYVPILLLTVAAAALNVVNLARPYWTPARSATRLAIHAVSFVVCAVLLRSNVWVVARTGGPVPGGAPADRVVDVVNASVEIGLFVAAVVILFEAGREGYRLRSRRKASQPSDSAPAGVGR